ncbi:hypothetical protein TrST_g542 [Triparma strigata]|uniref:Uncharacterized protein n=1 Tax=Triparma strigata TaxID=1606541 RepID=A0A9W7BP06_9STRA|nr:hypothetical protein TrST_g542 [Triparma strigata]
MDSLLFLNYRTAFDALSDRRDSHIVLRAFVGFMELLTPSPLLPPLTTTSLVHYILVSVLSRQLLLLLIIYLLSLLLLLPVYVLDVLLFDYTVLDVIVMYFVVSAICRFVKRSLAFPRGYCSDYWAFWESSRNPTPADQNPSLDKTVTDASRILPPDHPLRNLDVLPPYNLHHIKMVREVSESLTVYKEDEERWEFLEDVKFCLENSEGPGSDPAKGVTTNLERMLAENDASTPIPGNVLRAAFLASLNRTLQERDATQFATECGQYSDIIDSQLEFMAEAIHLSTTDIISSAHILADPRNMMNDDGNWTIVQAIWQMLKNALKFTSTVAAADFDLVLFSFGYVRQGRLRNLNRRKGIEASDVVIRETGKKGGLVEALWVKKEGSKGTVVYCNPNAGVWELTGQSLGLGVGGAGETGDEAGWIETYLRLGYDVVAFNYRGYGRSCFYPPPTSPPPFPLKCWRWFGNWFGSGGLKPASLKSDGLIVCDAVVGVDGNSKLIVHGESIGGMVAASAAEGRDDNTLLIVDRSFKCLEAVAENMLGGWVGVAMRVFLRGWNSDVVTSFEKKRGPKLICQDPFDQIINYTAGLMVGVSWKKEVEGDLEQHMFPVRVREEYVRMGEGRESEGGGMLFAPEKIAGGEKLGIETLAKFAAAVRSIGIRVTKGNKRAREGLEPVGGMAGRDFSDSDSDDSQDEEMGGGARTNSARTSAGRMGEGELRELNLAWNLLSVCDGLGGMGLGSAAKISLEAVCVWLCVCLRAGPCIVRRRSKYRTGGGDGIIDSDFDPRNPGGGRTARGGVALPAVLKGLKELKTSAGSWGQEVTKEIDVIILILDYAVETVKGRAGSGAGSGEEVQVVNLICGHNAPLGRAEMQELKYFIGKWESGEGSVGGGGGASATLV